MVDTNVYEDIAARCGGEIKINLQGEAGEKVADAFVNEKVLFINKADEASIGVVITRGEDLSGAVNLFKNANKPCVVVLDKSAEEKKAECEQKYAVPVIVADCERVTADKADDILRSALFEFPVNSFDIDVPEWMSYLSPDCSAVAELLERVRAVAPQICKMKDVSAFDGMLDGCQYWQGEPSVNMSLADGKIKLKVNSKDGIFFDMLSEIAGDRIGDECTLMRYVRATSDAKRSYDKIKDAYECAKINGYGIVEPDDTDMSLDKPQVVRQGGSVGIKLKATAPSYHIVKVDVTGEVSPIMGSAKQSEGIVEGMMNGFETNPDGMWETNVFGKSLRGMVKEGLAGKVCGMQDETKTKMRRAMTRIINEGKGGVICILL